MPEMIIRWVAPSELHQHPDQERIYGVVGREHDGEFGAFVVATQKAGILVPLVVSRGTPGLDDGTIISGHRRHAAATRNKFDTVPVFDVAYETPAHARYALLDFNRTRVKDEWVRSMEGREWYDVEATLAGQRKQAGLKVGSRSGTTSTTGQRQKTRDIVGAKLGESGKSVELRIAIVEKAEEQNPEHPEDSPAAADLKAGKPLAAIARKHGVTPGRGAPGVSRASAIAKILPKIRNAPTLDALAAAWVEATRMMSESRLTESDAKDIQDAYATRSEWLTSTQATRSADALDAALASIEAKTRTALGAVVPADIADLEMRAKCVATIGRIVALLAPHATELAPTGT